jgi:hypothetical protein
MPTGLLTCIFSLAGKWGLITKTPIAENTSQLRLWMGMFESVSPCQCVSLPFVYCLVLNTYFSYLLALQPRVGHGLLQVSPPQARGWGGGGSQQ